MITTTEATVSRSVSIPSYSITHSNPVHVGHTRHERQNHQPPGVSAETPHLWKCHGLPGRCHFRPLNHSSSTPFIPLVAATATPPFRFRRTPSPNLFGHSTVVIVVKHHHPNNRRNRTSSPPRQAAATDLVPPRQQILALPPSCGRSTMPQHHPHLRDEPSSRPLASAVVSPPPTTPSYALDEPLNGCLWSRPEPL
ncbi:putative DNA-directed RNA polymerase II subunit RPB1-like [Iris pallida]|uniref:DNA-directed RNA polymerase II subunit RPB1-like n=1 Tax=Iris pallida TaxID=29817 RepID=A0AAX6IJE7_IRIPA|nr:putative DNA-directed RNA polymerase II subunit RPB1-like [Iris pallida]